MPHFCERTENEAARRMLTWPSLRSLELPHPNTQTQSYELHQPAYSAAFFWLSSGLWSLCEWVFIFFSDVQKEETKKILSKFLFRVKLEISEPSSRKERNILKALWAVQKYIPHFDQSCCLSKQQTNLKTTISWMVVLPWHMDWHHLFYIGELKYTIC